MPRFVMFTTATFPLLLVVLLIIELVDLNKKPLQSRPYRSDKRIRRS